MGSSSPLGSESASFSKYRILAEIGQGGMAAVYLAVVRGPAGFHKLVVLKQIRPSLANDPDFLAMFLEEARLAARLNHPSIVQTNEVGEEDGRYFIAMEYLEGKALSLVLQRARVSGRHIPIGMQLSALSEVCAGLHYAHELTDYDGTPLGIVHRDVSPHNVLIGYQGAVKILDFGIAKACDSSSETRTGVLKGKVPYMAPEQALGTRVDRRADVYSVGVMLWEVVTGERMWKGLSQVAILSRLSTGELPRLRERRPDVLPELEAIVNRAVAPDREHRYATAADLQADLDRFLASRGERIPARHLGELVATEFAHDRAELRAFVDGQLRKAAAGALRAVPMIDVHAPSDPGASAKGSEGVHTAPPLVAPSTPPPLPLSLNPPPPLPRESRSRSGVLVALLFALAALVAVLAVVIYVLGPRAPAPLSAGPASTSAALSTPGAAPPPSVSPEPERITMTVHAVPADAKLFLDGAPLASNPATPSFVKGEEPHELRAEARGYSPKAVSVVPDKDKDVALALERVESRPAAELRLARPRTPPPPARAPQAIAAPEPKPDTREGYLNLDTYPWTRVFEGGKLLGQTPLLRVPLSVGDHTLVLENPEQNLRRTYVVTIAPGDTVSRRLGLK